MTETEQHILQTLNDLDVAVKSLSTANPKPDLRALFTRIEELTRRLPPETHPELLHFLNRKSYEKAKLFLLGREAEIRSGSCGR